MNEEVKTQWVAALRSGEYSQGRGLLRSLDGNYCCLGVLCELSGLGRWSGIVYVEPNGEEDARYPTGSVISWAGFEDKSPAVPIQARYCEKSVTLDRINDAGFTFPQIADIIEHFL